MLIYCFVPTDNLFANIFTKSLVEKIFNRLTDLLGMKFVEE